MAQTLNLGRVGHLFTPTGDNGLDDLPNGGCLTASVYDTDPTSGREPETVSVAAINRQGDLEIRRIVNVGPPSVEYDTFHLNKDCPWDR